MPHAKNADGQMRGQVDAAEKKERPKNEIDADSEHAQRDLLDSDSQDGSLHQGDHAGERQHRSAEHRRQGRKYSHAHVETLSVNAIWNAANGERKILTKI